MITNQEDSVVEFVERHLSANPGGITACFYTDKFNKIEYYDLLCLWMKGITAKIDRKNKALICTYH